MPSHSAFRRRPLRARSSLSPCLFAMSKRNKSNPLLNIVARQYDQYAPLWDEVARQLRARFKWKDDKCRAVTKELFRALVCKASDAQESHDLRMPSDLEKAWECAVLNSDLYAMFCEKALGAFVPHTTLSDQVANDAKNTQINAMKAKYMLVWDEEPSGEYWGGVAGDECSRPSEGEEPERKRAKEAQEASNASTSKAEAQVSSTRTQRSWTRAQSNRSPRSAGEQFQIFVKMEGGVTATFKAKSSTTVLEFKIMISQHKAGMPVEYMRLVCCGTQLEDGRSLGEYGVSRECTVHLLFRLRCF